ncbi:hypothetical protein Aglo03_58190 [Actinokineospora globicatena]|uniref:Short C-terminal domain-containing protein n=2 Tax=Actinokineospora globicatena TaxID=103729 RepID=A0A9W6QR38_9PSEU|nr:hypothetical protein Aglo03_58190 [Actinokineospora globicatena]
MLGMTEVTGREGTWVFDYDAVRVVPAKAAHPLRLAVGELVVPLAVIAAVGFETDRKGGHLRLRPRAGADPLTHVTGGALPEAADPFRLTIEPKAAASAEYFADGVRDARMVAGVPDGPAEGWLLPAPSAPLSTTGEDGVASFDGDRVRFEWGWAAESSKRSGGAREVAVGDLLGVEWTPKLVRLRPIGPPSTQPASHDPNCFRLWGFKKDIATSALLAASVVARLPHPAAGSASTSDTQGALSAQGVSEDQDTVLRRLRELGELRRDGVLTEDEFSAAKQALLRKL